MNVKMEKLIFLLACFNLVFGFELSCRNSYSLDIIHYNDFHARFEETSIHYPTCRFNNGSCIGGFPRLYHEINSLLKEKPHALLLNAGDSFQGTYWYTLLKWNVIQEFMNMLPHDAHAIGNHEFDDGPEGLAPYLAALKAPILAANMDVSEEHVLQGLFQNSLIVERKGRKIGIIGLITQETEHLSSSGKVKFTDPGEATDREVKLLVEQGVDIIILLSHCGLQVDKQLARDHGDHIDIIVGGHTHSLLWDGPTPSGETAAGPYPYIVNSTKNPEHQVLIVQSSAFTKYMGNLTVFFDCHGNYLKWEGGPIFLNRSYPEDEEIKEKLAPYAQKVHEAEQGRVGEITTTLLADDCVFGECALGNLLVDSNQAYTKEKVNSTYDYISFMQSGNIKSSLPKGVINNGMIFELLPYDDKVVHFELKGRYVLEALERAVMSAWSLDPFKGPFMLQVSGLRVTYNVSKPEDERVVSVFVGDTDNTTRALDSDATYLVSMPKYLSDGGDGYSMFAAHKQNVQVMARDQAIIKLMLQRNSPMTVKTDGRIKILY